MENFWCKIGLHDWYKGNFSFPVWGRYERHCLCCDKKQYKVHRPKEKWITFLFIVSLFLISCGTKTEAPIQEQQMNTLPVLPAESILNKVDSASNKIQDTAYIEGSHDDLVFFENDSNIIPRSEFK